jgi:ATP-dependent 26S proteasome regulatory subunit
MKYPNTINRTPVQQSESAPEMYPATAPKCKLNQVYLSSENRKEMDLCLAMIRNHDLIYNTWGLSQLESRGAGLVINFYGPPGTGKTKTAEALAGELEKNLLEANYSRLVSQYQGQTGKNIEEVFASAARQQAVLFFDEADSLLSRRSESTGQAGAQDLNTAKSIMLRQMDKFDGVVIFATNLFTNYDPAFCRRITWHIPFDLPCHEVRKGLWQYMISAKVPGRDTINFEALAARSDGLSGGDMVNVIKQTLCRVSTKTPAILTQEDIHASITSLRKARQAQQGIEERVLDGDEKSAVLRTFSNH